MKQLPKWLLILFFFISGCATKCDNSLDGIQRLTRDSAGTSKIGAIRGQSLRDSALSMGARAGLACRANQINAILLQQEPLLYRVFNFNAIMLDKSVLPPVLIEGRNTLNLAGPEVIRISDRTYSILAQARFVTAPPSWRDYLWMNFCPPETPDRSLLPKSQAERLLWKKYVEEGWQAGFKQGDTIFRENIGRLKRDFEGMLRYRTLLAQNMVSPPFVAAMDLGVTGGGADMTINDRILRITALPALQSDSQSWKTEITPNE